MSGIFVLISTINPDPYMHDRYTYTAMLFHWLIALLVVGMDATQLQRTLG